jgi:hypothetical protein
MGAFQMDISAIGKMLGRKTEQAKASEDLKTEASKFQLATNNGYIKVLKYLLFILFGFYNARLFLTTIAGWEKYHTALFALLGECTALYCYDNYTKSTGRHKAALGIFGIALFVFAFTHASISYFKMERGDYSDPIRFYCEHVAFPVLFGLLLLAAIVIPLMHWRTRIAAAQAKAQVEIDESRAKLVAQTSQMNDENELERARIEHFKEKVKIGNEYAAELRNYALMKQTELDALLEMPEPMRSQIASELGIDLSKQPKPVVAWRGGERVDRGN